MEADKNPFPKIDLFPRVTKVVSFIFRRLEAETENTGGGPMLDRELYDQLELPYDRNEL